MHNSYRYCTIYTATWCKVSV